MTYCVSQFVEYMRENGESLGFYPNKGVKMSRVFSDFLSVILTKCVSRVDMDKDQSSVSLIPW